MRRSKRGPGGYDRKDRFKAMLSYGRLLLLLLAIAPLLVSCGSGNDPLGGGDDDDDSRTDLVVDADTELGGAVAVDNLTITAGTTVTLSADLEIDANGVVTIEGAVMGDCFGVKIEAAGAVTISGTVNNACATQAMGGEDAPAIEIDAPGGVNLDGATIVSSGPVTVVSEPASSSPSRAPRAASSLLRTPGAISLVGTTVRADPTQAPQAESLDEIPNGANDIFRATTEIIINGATIRAQHGGDGLRFNETSSDPLDVSGGTGGAGGNISLSTPAGGIIRFVTSMGTSEFIPGDGGPGGPATATTTENAGLDPAPRARAFGGPGGDGGGTTILGAASITGDLDLIRWQVGIGGRGGNATATGADGVDADGSRSAQVGGAAVAQAGFGGDAGATSGGFVGMLEADNQEGGGGGIGRATGGKGGDGIRSNPPGAAGGEPSAEGGSGGGGWGRAGNIGGDAIASGGDGGLGADICPGFTDFSLSGQISVASDPASSDQFIFGAGAGAALSLVYRILSALGGPGGDGGDGALLSASGGEGGSRLDTASGRREQTAWRRWAQAGTGETEAPACRAVRPVTRVRTGPARTGTPSSPARFSSSGSPEVPAQRPWRPVPGRRSSA